MDDADWTRLIDQLRMGHCTPFIGPGVFGNSPPIGPDLGAKFAARYHYPFADSHDLSRVMQFASVTTGDPVYIKEMICRGLDEEPPPDFSDPAEPHGFLAGFPLPVFMTTNYDDYMAQALRRAGKSPRSVICPWTEEVLPARYPAEPAPDADPTAEQPLVFHLHGMRTAPASWSSPRTTTWSSSSTSPSTAATTTGASSRPPSPWR